MVHLALKLVLDDLVKHLGQWFSTGAYFAPWKTSRHVWRHFLLSQLGGRDGCVPPASSG